MAILDSYPHYEINVEDRSRAEVLASETLPIHRPIYPMKCQKGEIGVPVWCPTITEARRLFGAETFNVLNKAYYSQSSEFLNNTFINNGAFIVRLADAAAAANAFAILEVAAKEVDVPQYEKDANGALLRDENGDLIPELDGNDDPIVEPGYELTWQIRTALEVDEDFDDLQIRTTVVGADTITYYPILSFKATSPGLWGNDVGFKFFWSHDENEASRVARVGAMYFSLSPIIKDYGVSTVDTVRDKYNNVFNSFVLKPDTIDASIAKTVSIDEILENAYNEGDGLPFVVKSYGDNAKTLGDLLMAVEVNRNGTNDVDAWATDEITDGWMVNIATCRDLDNRPYDHIVLGSTSDVMSSSVVHYMDNGVDGDLEDSDVESLYQDFLSLDMNPDIVDRARYPFTHIFDVGWSIDTKYAMCDFQAIRDDVKIVLSTQRSTSVGGVATLNDQATDESIGSAVRARALLIPESIIKGTECFRATIMMQAGYLSGSLYAGIIPATIWYAQKLAFFHSTTRMNGAPEGLPNSEIDVYKEWNWTPSSDAMKSRSWNTGLNYFQYFDMRRLHYASIRTVYRYDTSVLNIDDFSNAIIYTKHEVRQVWAIFAGLTIEDGELASRVTDTLGKRLDVLYNGRYTFAITVYQTAEEALLGYVHHVEITLSSPSSNRVWNVDIVCTRPTAAE